MGNIIVVNDKTLPDEYISMSNRITDTFINVLVLAGSELAKSDDEKRLIVWLAEKDQSCIGMGCVGFDIGDMPFNAEHFGKNKNFLLNVINAAENRLNWERLEYEPNQEFITAVLERFYDMLSKVEVSDINKSALSEYIKASEEDDPILCGFPKCRKHGVFLTCFGCQVCNN